MDVWLRNGRLYLTGAVHEAQLRSCCAVALLAREERWLLYPLMSGAGGLTVKQRNLRGDRVIEAQEFFRGLGFPDSPVIRPLELTPDHEHAAFQLRPIQ